MPATDQSSPFAELRRLYGELAQRKWEKGVDGTMVRKLRDVAGEIEAVHATAAEMQLGAEGFDNTGHARAYASVQEHLDAAAKRLVAAALILSKQAER